MFGEPQAEHAWLQRLVGEWTYDADCFMGPDKPRERSQGSEIVRPFGKFWIHLDGTGQMPDGSPAHMQMTLGFDPALGRYVGTWIGSMMPRLWVYDITRDGDVLNMDADGPSFEDPAKTQKYRDIITIVDANTRTLTGNTLGEDGKYHEFMTTTYRRKA